MLLWILTSVAEHVLKMVELVAKYNCQRRFYFSRIER